MATKRIPRNVGVALVLACVAGLAGCSLTEPTGALAQGKKYLLPQEPAGAQPVSEVKKAAEQSTEAGSAPVGVVLVGRIGAGAGEPFETGKALFVVSEYDPDAHADGPGHDADDCPFCKRKAAQAPKAIVQIVDDQGRVVATDARQLLGLKKGQVVVVRGRAAFDRDADSLVVTADGLHVRR